MPQSLEPTHPAKTIAALLRLTERRVQQLAKEGVIPKAERGRYQLAPSVQGYIKYLQDRAAPEMSGKSIDYAVEKARLTRAHADIAEMEAEKMRGSVIDAAEVTRGWQVLVTEVRAKLLHNVPVRIAAAAKSETDESKLKRMIKSEISEALRALAGADADHLLGGDDGSPIR